MSVTWVGLWCPAPARVWSGRAVWKRFVQLSTVVMCLHEWFVRVVRHSEILQQVLPLPFLVPFSQVTGFAVDFHRYLLCTLVVVAPLPSVAPALCALLHKQERLFLSTSAPQQASFVFPACKKPGYRSGWVLYPPVARGLVFSVSPPCFCLLTPGKARGEGTGPAYLCLRVKSY